MLDYWTNLALSTRFSIIAFIVALPLGLLSMGILGFLLYYPASLILPAYPNPNDWRGDWVWPATIGIGMAWSVGFLLAGVAWHYLADLIDSVVVLRVVYALIVYGWAAFLWWMVLRKQF